MLGYLKPYPYELLGKYMLRYKSVYCGLCHNLSERYGQIPRFALTYDLTTFAVLLLAFEAEEGEPALRPCAAVFARKKHPVAPSSPPLDYAADMTLLLVNGRIQDDIADGENIFKRTGLSLTFKKAIRKAYEARPELARTIDALLAKEREAAQRKDREEAIESFAAVMREIFLRAPWPDQFPKALLPVMGDVGADLGRWIYWMDAVEDEEKDRAAGLFNVIGDLTPEEVDRTMMDLELNLDRHLALLPYQKDAELVQNLVHWSLPETRRRLFKDEPLWRV